MEAPSLLLAAEAQTRGKRPQNSPPHVPLSTCIPTRDAPCVHLQAATQMCRGRLLPHHFLSGNRWLGGSPPACPRTCGCGISPVSDRREPFPSSRLSLRSPLSPSPELGVKATQALRFWWTGAGKQQQRCPNPPPSAPSPAYSLTQFLYRPRCCCNHLLG